RWPGCGGAAESRRGEVASILRETEQKKHQRYAVSIDESHGARIVLNKRPFSGVFFDLFFGDSYR
ncbi:hypothetical protein AWP46_03685, partial [Escherichia coli]|uniref:hypothetical protein n=1 Tax=Escherichia coli TaxID=562 RepID=UPI0009437DB6